MQNLEKLVEKFNLEEVETTVGNNGYPKHTNTLLTCDSLTDLSNAVEELEKSNYDVEIYQLKRKYGQHFWNRYCIGFINSFDPLIVDDQDYAIYLDSSMNEQEMKEVISIALFATEEDMGEDYNPNDDDINSFYDEIGYLDLKNVDKIVIFYNPEQNSVDYVVTDDSTNYSFDATEHCVAIEITEIEE